MGKLFGKTCNSSFLPQKINPIRITHFSQRIKFGRGKNSKVTNQVSSKGQTNNPGKNVPNLSLKKLRKEPFLNKEEIGRKGLNKVKEVLRRMEGIKKGTNW